jgi:tRNA dimethylallyltransferase
MPQQKVPPPELLPPLIIIGGPTAAGKTSLGVFLARKFNGVIVSADSRQIYRGMDIGTGKEGYPHPPKPLRFKTSLPRRLWARWSARCVPQFLISICRPSEAYTAARFQQDAHRVIEHIHQAGKLPILVGGTWLYLQAVSHAFSFPPVPPQAELRRRLSRQSSKQLWQAIVRRDPEATKFLDFRNRRRLVRALEVILTTGRKFSSLRRSAAPPYCFLYLGVAPPPAELHRRIEQRVAEMLARGLVEETRHLLRYYSPRLPALSGIGYQECIDFIRGRIKRKELPKQIVRRTKELARRQLSWFRRQKQIKWIDSRATAARLVRQFLQNHL